MLLNVFFATLVLLFSTSCNTSATDESKTTVVQERTVPEADITIAQSGDAAIADANVQVSTTTTNEVAATKLNEKKIITTSPVNDNSLEKSSTKSITPATEKPIAAKPIAVEETDMGTRAMMATNTITHEGFDRLLQQYVSSNGTVDYKGLKANRAALDEYTTLLAKAIPAGDWSKNESLAYWINAYNAFTLQLIINNYPLKSITNLDGGKPWDVKRITLAGKKYSLNNIENDIIRPQFKDPRIHFALNCAAVSCPPLDNKAFTEDNIEALLNSRTSSFLNSSANIITENKATISKVFDWYKQDFSNVVTFINKYSKTKLAAKAGIAYKDYDWTLNSK